jgi:tRNA pseudouridine-54 N-methylase
MLFYHFTSNTTEYPLPNITVRSQPTAACQLLLNADCLATAFWLAASFEQQIVILTVLITHRHFLCL